MCIYNLDPEAYVKWRKIKKDSNILEQEADFDLRKVLRHDRPCCGRI